MLKVETPEELLDLCRACTRRDPPPFSRSHRLKLASYYLLFNRALELGAEIYQLSLTELQQWKTQIDWDYKRQTVGAGLNGKLTKPQARAALKRRLGDLHANRLDA